MAESLCTLPCNVEGCDKTTCLPDVYKPWCSKHYMAMLRKLPWFN